MQPINNKLTVITHGPRADPWADPSKQQHSSEEIIARGAI